jgi:hypothetical protein
MSGPIEQDCNDFLAAITRHEIAGLHRGCADRSRDAAQAFVAGLVSVWRAFFRVM